jgi:conjugative relaxase-like TrwC/TraI family protein
VLSLAKLAATDQRYYLDQAEGRVDHAGSVSSGVEDYYLAGPEAAGRWTGSAVQLLGLNGPVSEASLRAVLSQRNPRSGEKMAGPVARARVPGFDLMFSVPKSASVLFGIGDDLVQRAVLQAQERAVAAGLSYLERHACRTRRGAGGHEVVRGAGFLGAAFGHRTSRAGDPQIHTHVLVANATRGGDGLWGTLDGRQIYAHAKTAGYVHEAVFRRELADRLGVRRGAARNGIADIDGVSGTVINAFSRRRSEIDAQVAQWGRTSAGARQSAALATRARKDYGVTPAMLAPEWRQRAEALGLDRRAVTALLDDPAARELTPHEQVAQRLLSPNGLTAKASTFDRRDVVQAVAAQARDGASLQEIEMFTDRLLGHAEVVPLTAGAGGHVQRADVIRRADGRTVSAIADAPRYSTVELLATEQQVVDEVLARRNEGAGVVQDDVLRRVLETRATLGADQAAMVRRLCTDGHGVQIVVGPPGTGKTFALDAAREAWQASGFVVCGAAVARQAARGLWDVAGIQSTSGAALLGDLGRGGDWGMTARTVLVIDEAGMLGTRDLARLLAHASPAGAKVVLVGDHHQLPEIDAGGLFRALVARTDPVRLTVNRRQHEPHAREMLDLWRRGRVLDALKIAAEHGEFAMAASAEQLQGQMVADYCKAIEAGEDAVMITQRRAEAHDLNTRARAWLDAAGRLGADRVELSGGQFAVGDRVVLKLNDRRLDVENGNRGSIVTVDSSAGALVVQLTGDRVVTLPRSYLQRTTTTGDPALLHGYAGTAHIAQGMTTGHAFVLGSDTAYREWGYVAWSRARLQTRFYVCEPDVDLIAGEHHTAAGHDRDGFNEVVDAMEHSRAQRAAVEFVDGARDKRPVEWRASSRALGARRGPPAYILGVLGPRPAEPASAVTWDRAVQFVERYRVEHGISDTADALGPRPANLLAQVAWRRARRTLERTPRELSISQPRRAARPCVGYERQ